MKTLLKWLAVFLISVVLSHPTALADEIPKLSSYQADLSQTTVSGLSSGAFMASQLHVAYSDKLVGAGIIAGGPFYCASSYGATPDDFLEEVVTTCMTPITAFVAPDGKELFQSSQKLAKINKIADLDNLKDDKVYLFSGTKDRVVKTLVVDQVNAFYQAAGLKPENIQYIKNIAAGHAIIVAQDATECAKTESPFINDCDFMQSHQILTHLYGNLNPPAEVLSSRVIKFDQSEFIKAKNTSMSESAYVYVPKACETETCKVHVAIHGCLQGASVIGDNYYTTTGYNEIADTNHIIVLYPQVNPSKVIPYNPKGCWDFWGYSSADPERPVFYTRESPQMQAIMAMVERLGESRLTELKIKNLE